MKKSYFFKINRFPYGKIRQLLLPLKLTVILSICITLNAVASNLGVNNTSAISVQQKKVSGTVTDASNNNEPLVGVSIAVVGTTSGTITDAQGKYSLVLPNGDVSLTFSFVGYVTQTVKVNGQSTIDIGLALDVKKLDEVVVVGYGTVKKSDISGSVASVNTEEMIRKNPQNVTLGLQGAAAGVVVTQQDGAPDGNVTIRIRGLGTINGSALPLYVVDGIEISNPNANQNSGINFLNPNDIENVEILKDASATAIYGSRGANGVIMITTKHGTAGATNITFSANFGVQSLAWELPVGNVDQFAQDIRAARANDAANLSNQVFAAQYDGKRKNIDWQKQLTHAAVKSQYNITASGGGDKTQSLLSISYLNNDGLIVNTNMNRFTCRANIVNKPVDFLEIGADMSFVHTESHGSNTSIAGANASNLSSQKDMAIECPTMDYVTNGGVYVSPNVVNSNGTYGTTIQSTFGAYDGGATDNLYAQQMESNNLFRNNQVLINAYGIVKLFKGLSFKAVGSYNYSGGDNWNFYGNKARYMPDGVTLITLTGYDPAQTLFVQDQQSTELRLQNYLTYNWKNEVHNLTLMAGFEVSTWGGTWANATAKGFQAPNIRQVSLTNNLASRSGDAQVQDKSNNVSYFGRLNYSFKDRYIITASLREDGSSNFGVGNQFGIFPSAAVAWRISEEDFLKGNPTISNLKLRLSWGETGNAGSQALLGVAQLNPNITNSGGSSPADYKTYPVNGMSGLSSNATENYGIVPSMIDTNLKWETDVEENIGIDLGLYKNWTISAEFFNKISENLLLNKGTRISTGYPSVYTNYGSIQNKGYELMVNYKNNINKDWFFNGTATFSTVTNRVIQLGVDQYAQNTGGTGDGSNLGPVHSSDGVHWDQSSLMREGYAVGTFYGYKVLGIIQSQQQIDALNANAAAKGLGHYQQAYTQPGDFLYMNTTGTGNVTIADRKPLGNGFPKLVYGFNFNLGYKSWDFSCATSGVMGVKILSYSAMELTDFYGSDAGTLPNLLSENSQKAWTPTNHSTTVPRLSILDFNDNMACNSAWVKNGDYFKVRNVQLGYNLPKNLLKPLHIQSSRINISIDNVITISSYRKYGDPEVGQGSPLFTGVDGGRYPFPRTYSVGLNLQF